MDLGFLSRGDDPSLIFRNRIGTDLHDLFRSILCTTGEDGCGFSIYPPQEQLVLYLSTSENVGRLEYAHVTIRFIKQLMSVALRPNRCRLRTILGGSSP